MDSLFCSRLFVILQIYWNSELFLDTDKVKEYHVRPLSMEHSLDRRPAKKDDNNFIYMINITCPNDNLPERTYAIDMLLHHLLGIEKTSYQINFEEDAHDYTIAIGNKRIVFEDHFFKLHKEPLSYLNSSNIPDKLTYFHGEGMEIPIIYGTDKMQRESNGDVVVGLDIFASTFFMLTRWEENLLGREETGDCKEQLLFTVKNGIHKRAIVNEYEVLLKRLLAGEGITYKSRNFGIVLTHDVDGLTPSWLDIAKDFVRRVMRRPVPEATTSLVWKEFMKYKRTYPDAFSQMVPYIKICKKFGIPEIFYMKVCDKGELEATYIHDSASTLDVIRRLKDLESDKVLIGFHPSQSTFQNKAQWTAETERFHAQLGKDIVHGRNHHLMYNNETLCFWESILTGSEEDTLHISNCVFHNTLGLRSGIAVPYPLFDVVHRKEMRLTEHPCSIMDTAIRLHKYKTDAELWKDIDEITGELKKYQGELLLTWHIYVRNVSLLRRYMDLCEKIIEKAS